LAMPPCAFFVLQIQRRPMLFKRFDLVGMRLVVLAFKIENLLSISFLV